MSTTIKHLDKALEKISDRESRHINFKKFLKFSVQSDLNITKLDLENFFNDKAREGRDYEEKEIHYKELLKTFEKITYDIQPTIETMKK